MENAAKYVLKKALPSFILEPISRLRSYSLVEGSLTYRQDGLYTTCNTEFLQEPKFVECGVYRGAMSRMIAHYIGFENMPHKRFYLFDTFRGLPHSCLTDEERRRR